MTVGHGSSRAVVVVGWSQRLSSRAAEAAGEGQAVVTWRCRSRGSTGVDDSLSDSDVRTGFDTMRDGEPPIPGARHPGRWFGSANAMSGIVPESGRRAERRRFATAVASGSLVAPVRGRVIGTRRTTSGSDRCVDQGRLAEALRRRPKALGRHGVRGRNGGDRRRREDYCSHAADDNRSHRGHTTRFASGSPTTTVMSGTWPAGTATAVADFAVTSTCALAGSVKLRAGGERVRPS